AHMVYGVCELDNVASCTALEREGYRLYGIMPDSEVREVAPGVAKFVLEGIYVKLLVPPEVLIRPEPGALLPRTAALFDMIGSPAAAAAASFGPSPLPSIPE